MEANLSQPKSTIIDRILAASLLKLVPDRVTPNELTVSRFIFLIPVSLSLYFEYYSTGLILFLIAAFTDVLDGALARTRNKVTDWGKLYDPLADKLLIGLTAFIMVYRFLDIDIVLGIVGLEILLIIQAAYQKYVKKGVVEAKLPGKIKMILQSVGIGLVFLFAIFGLPIYIELAEVSLVLAIIFAFISLVVYQAI